MSASARTCNRRTPRQLSNQALNQCISVCRGGYPVRGTVLVHPARVHKALESLAERRGNVSPSGKLAFCRHQHPRLPTTMPSPSGIPHSLTSCSRRHRLFGSVCKLLTLSAPCASPCKLNDPGWIPSASASPQRLRFHLEGPTSPRPLWRDVDNSGFISTTSLSPPRVEYSPRRSLVQSCREAIDLRPPSGIIRYVVRFLLIS